MANILTSRNLIVEETGETNLWVLKGMARRRAMAEYGSLSRYALRLSLRYYSDLIAELSADWRLSPQPACRFHHDYTARQASRWCSPFGLLRGRTR